MGDKKIKDRSGQEPWPWGAIAWIMCYIGIIIMIPLDLNKIVFSNVQGAMGFFMVTIGSLLFFLKLFSIKSSWRI